LRKLALTGATICALLVMAALAAAAAAPVMTVEAAVTPSDAGTSKKPKNSLLHIKFNVNQDSESTLRRIEYTIPSGVKVSGRGFKTCSADTINQSGESACPAGSKVGTGAATAVLGKGPSASNLVFTVTVYAAGKHALALYLKTNLFTVAIPATISGQTVGFDIPESVQNPTGGANGPYSYVTSVTADLGKQDGISGKSKIKKKVTVRRHGKKKRVTRKVPVYFVSSVSCPAGGYAVGVKAFLASNPSPPSQESISGSATAPCTK
jgi:hypothetical protein